MEQLKCKLCGEDFSPSKYELYHEHLLHEVHITNAKQAGLYYCELCDCGATSEDSFRRHVNGHRHEKVKLNLIKLADRRNYDLMTGASSPTSDENTLEPKWVTTPNGPYMICPLCKGTPCNSEQDLSKHMHKCRQKQSRTYSLDQVQEPLNVGPISINNVTEAEIHNPNVITRCDICDTSISGYENKKQHDSGQKHLKKQRMNEIEEKMRRLGTMPKSKAEEQGTGHANLARSNSQDSNISDADTIMSYATAASELSSISALECNVPENFYIEKQSTTESTIVSQILPSTESECRISLETSNYGLDDAKPTYKKGKGYCVIINQATFPDDKGGPRNGTDVDADHLLKTFQYLNFETRMERDLTCEDMKMRLEEIAYYLRNNPNKYALMCICLLSHGENDFIHGIDGQGMHINDIRQIFDSKNCSAMTGKPKLFFTNACRGLNEPRRKEV